MSNVEVITVEDREQWLRLRTTDLTASDVAAVAGFDPHRSPLRVYAEKTGMTEPGGDNQMMRRGRWMEAAVVEALRETRPTWDIQRAGVYLRDKDIRLGATPDVIAIDPTREGFGNIQCKVVSRPIFEEEWADDRPPLRFEIQTLTEAMLLAGSSTQPVWAAVAALSISTYTADLVIAEVDRHASAEARIRTLAVNFWKDVEDGNQPSVDFVRDSALVDELHPHSHPGVVREFKDDIWPHLLSEHQGRKVDIKVNQDRVDIIETEIKAHMGDAETGTLPGWRISWKEQSRGDAHFRVLRITETPTDNQEGPF